MLGGICFNVFELFGMWCPLSWTSQWKKSLYSFYSFVCVLIYTTFSLTLLLHIWEVKDIDDLTVTLFTLSHACNILVKMITIIIHRKIIIESKHILSDELCQPRDLNESDLLFKHLHIARMCTLVFLSITSLNAASLILSPLTDKNNISLPLKTWVPYSVDSKHAFFLTYMYQSLALIMSAFITGSVECLALLIMLIICAQLEIFIYRLHLLPKFSRNNKLDSIAYEYESKLIKDCVEHHICTFSLGDKLNQLFGIMIFVQFFSSMILLCALIYQLTALNVNNQYFWSIIPLLLSSLLQIFIYCFLGETLKEKSLLVVEAVYKVKWIEITNHTRKDLIMIMMQASRPMKLNGLSFVIMSFYTFVKVLKSAFSAYNLLVNL